MKPLFTQGPWKTSQTMSDKNHIAVIKNGEVPKIIAFIPKSESGNSAHEVAANVDLIAQAPAMAEFIQRWFEHSCITREGEIIKTGPGTIGEKAAEILRAIRLYPVKKHVYTYNNGIPIHQDDTTETYQVNSFDDFRRDDHIGYAEAELRQSMDKYIRLNEERGQLLKEAEQCLRKTYYEVSYNSLTLQDATEKLLKKLKQ